MVSRKSISAPLTVYTLLHLLMWYNNIMEYKIKRYCRVCGRIHTGRCKPSYHVHRGSEADKFRNTQSWKRTAKMIMERDLNCCRVCLLDGILKNRELSVHHIIPLSEDFNLRLDPDNLITLCRYHHEQAENGRVSRKKLLELAKIPVSFPEIYPPRGWLRPLGK